MGIKILKDNAYIKRNHPYQIHYKGRFIRHYF